MDAASVPCGHLFCLVCITISLRTYLPLFYVHIIQGSTCCKNMKTPAFHRYADERQTFFGFSLTQSLFLFSGYQAAIAAICPVFLIIFIKYINWNVSAIKPSHLKSFTLLIFSFFFLSLSLQRTLMNADLMYHHIMGNIHN